MGWGGGYSCPRRLPTPTYYAHTHRDTYIYIYTHTHIHIYTEEGVSRKFGNFYAKMCFFFDFYQFIYIAREREGGMTGPFCLFLTGRRYWRYTGSRLDSGYPRPLPTNFSNVRAAFQWSDRGIYLFNRGQYGHPAPPHTPAGLPITNHVGGVTDDGVGVIDDGFGVTDDVVVVVVEMGGTLMTGLGISSLMTGLGSQMTWLDQ